MILWRNYLGLGALLVLTFAVMPQNGNAAVCDAQNPWHYKEICYPSQAAAEAAMREPTGSSGQPQSGDWRIFFKLKVQIGNLYVYDLPNKPHLPNPAWRADMPNGYYAWGWRTFKSPAYHTSAEALTWAVEKAALPTFYKPAYIVSDNLIYRGNYADASNYDHRVYSDDHATPPVSVVDFTAPNLAHRYCTDFTPGVVDAKVSKFNHTLYRTDSIPLPAELHVGWNNCLVDGIWYRINGMPTVHVREENVGLCQTPYVSDGTQCVSGEEEEIFNGAAFALETPVQPRECPKIDETNPCNPADGTKTQIEVDIVSPAPGSPEFVRYYRSKGAYKTGVASAPGWRHTYSRQLDEEPETRPTVSFAAPANQSSFYYTPAEACTSGWDDLKSTVWSGDLSLATASFSGGNVCKISQGGTTVAYFPVRAATGFTGFTPPTNIKTVSRPDGSVVTFEYGGTDWVNYLNPSLKLAQVGSNWVYTDSNDIKETFDATGKLISIETRDGLVTTLLYGTSGYTKDKPIKVTGPFGHYVTIGYKYPTGELSYLIAAGEGIVRYYYTGEKLTSTKQDFMSGERFYLYEKPELPHHLTGIIDKNGDRYATWDYDTAGRAILSEHAGGKESVQLSYNVDGSTTLTLGNGATRTYDFSTQQGQRKLAALSGNVCSSCPGGDIAERSYDGNGYVDELEDWNGNITQSIRNARGLTETLIEAKGTFDERTTLTTWHSTYRLPMTIISPKNTTNFTYDANGNLETVSVTDGTDTRTWTITNNANGQPLTIDGPRIDVTDITTLAYYSCTTGTQCGQLMSMTNALGHVTTYDSYNPRGRPLQITDPNGLRTILAYNYSGNVKSIELDPTTGYDRITTITYDNDGKLKTVTTPDGRVLTYTYDAAHYLSNITDNFGNRVDYDYDAMGNLKDEDTYDPSSTLKRAIDYAYDLNNRLDMYTNGGFTTDMTIDMVGNLTNVVDPKLASTQHIYDALNRLDQTIDAISGVVDYGYDEHDNITSVTAANGAATTYQYDDFDQLTREISPDRGMIDYTYDEAGNRNTELDARGMLTTYAYDALNRLTLITLDGGGTIAYEYDVGTNAIGRLNKITDASGQTAWTYDNFGAVTQKTQTLGTVALTTGYGYDINGRLTSITMPSGKVVTYGYNVFLPNSVTVDSTSILSGATYDPFGPVNGWTWGNSSTASRNFTLRGLMDSVAIAGSARTLGYDAAGQITSLTDTRHTDTFDYDLLGRLDDFDHSGTAPLPPTQDFTYDANGNRASITEGGTPYSYTNLVNANRLLSTTGPTAKTFTYDAAGNVTNDGIHTYSYDDRGRLTGVDSGSVTYEHNGQGQRVSKDDGSKILFAYDEAGNLIGEYDSLGTAIQETVYFNGAPVAVLDGSSKHYVHTDQLGTPRVITDGNTIIWRWESDPFGTTAAQEDPDGDLTLLTYNLRFPGQYYDNETGLHYNYFRTYDPSTGRYLESDPIGLAAGPNTYSYVSNMPMMQSDRFGLANDNSVCGGLPPQYQLACYQDRANPRQNKESYDFYTEVGGCIAGVCIESRIGGTSPEVLFAPELIGGGFSFCMEITPDPESCPISDVAQPESILDGIDELSFGAGRRLGITLNSNKLCINLGRGIGSPVTPAHSLGEKPVFDPDQPLPEFP